MAAAERTPLTFVRFGPSQRFLRGLRPLVSVGHPPASRERGSSRLPAATTASTSLLFPVALEDGVVGIDAAVPEERPAPAHILSAIKVNVDDFVFFVVGI